MQHRAPTSPNSWQQATTASASRPGWLHTRTCTQAHTTLPQQPCGSLRSRSPAAARCSRRPASSWSSRALCRGETGCPQSSASRPEGRGGVELAAGGALSSHRHTPAAAAAKHALACTSSGVRSSSAQTIQEQQSHLVHAAVDKHALEAQLLVAAGLVHPPCQPHKQAVTAGVRLWRAGCGGGGPSREAGRSGDSNHGGLLHDASCNTHGHACGQPGCTLSEVLSNSHSCRQAAMIQPAPVPHSPPTRPP